jgi:hypothetical protein
MTTPNQSTKETTDMAFSVRNLSVLAYANGFTLWHYKLVNETLAAATANGYFDQASDMLTVGDILMISGRDGSTVRGLAGGDGEPFRLSAI